MGWLACFWKPFEVIAGYCPGGVRGVQVLALAAALIPLEVMGQAEDAAV